MANGKLPILKSSMVDYVKSHAEDIVKGLEVLPGVETLLQRLSSQKNVIIGLVSIVEPILFVTWFFIYFLAYCFFLHVFSVNDFLSVVGKELFVVGTKLYACVSLYQHYACLLSSDSRFAFRNRFLHIYSMLCGIATQLKSKTIDLKQVFCITILLVHKLL